MVGRGWGHTEADTLDKISLRGLQMSAILVARLAARMAQDDELPGPQTVGGRGAPAARRRGHPGAPAAVRPLPAEVGPPLASNLTWAATQPPPIRPRDALPFPRLPPTDLAGRGEALRPRRGDHDFVARVRAPHSWFVSSVKRCRLDVGRKASFTRHDEAGGHSSRAKQLRPYRRRNWRSSSGRFSQSGAIERRVRQHVPCGTRIASAKHSTPAP